MRTNTNPANLLALVLILAGCNSSGFTGSSDKSSPPAPVQEGDVVQQPPEQTPPPAPVPKQPPPNQPAPPPTNPPSTPGIAEEDERACHSSVAVALALDTSMSMQEGTRLSSAKQSANTFLQGLRQGDSIGLIGFARSAGTHYTISDDTAGAITALQNIEVDNGGFGTDINAALQAGSDMLDSVDNPETNRIIVLLSDGEHMDLNAMFGGTPGPSPTDTATGIKDSGIRIITVAFEAKPEGSQVMSGVATAAEDAIDSPNEAALADAFAQIARSLCRGN